MSLTTMNTFHDTAPTTTSNLPTKGQIKNFDPTALIQTFRLEYEDADQHDHLNVLIEQTAAPEKKLHENENRFFSPHPGVLPSIPTQSCLQVTLRITGHPAI